VAEPEGQGTRFTTRRVHRGLTRSEQAVSLPPPVDAEEERKACAIRKLECSVGRAPRRPPNEVRRRLSTVSEAGGFVLASVGTAPSPSKTREKLGSVSSRLVPRGGSFRRGPAAFQTIINPRRPYGNAFHEPPPRAQSAPCQFIRARVNTASKRGNIEVESKAANGDPVHRPNSTDAIDLLRPIAVLRSFAWNYLPAVPFALNLRMSRSSPGPAYIRLCDDTASLRRFLARSRLRRFGSVVRPMSGRLRHCHVFLPQSC